MLITVGRLNNDKTRLYPREDRKFHQNHDADGQRIAEGHWVNWRQLVYWRGIKHRARRYHVTWCHDSCHVLQLAIAAWSRDQDVVCHLTRHSARRHVVQRTRASQAASPGSDGSLVCIIM
jgi:hypothetical protein